MQARSSQIGIRLLTITVISITLSGGVHAQQGLSVENILETLAAEGIPGTLPDTPLTSCFQFDAAPEIYGPTAINAETGNQHLGVAFNRHGTITVLRWPFLSFYDQINYRTHDRNLPRYGAAANAGAFLGLVVDMPKGSRMLWLRDLPSSQRYADPWSDAVETTYVAEELGLRVRVVDVAVVPDDVLLRRVRIRRDAGSSVRSAQLVAFENLNLVVSKLPLIPIQDWCFEELNTDRARYDQTHDAIVHSKRGIDVSTGKSQKVAIGMALAGSSAGYQVGGDARIVTGTPDAGLPGPTQDAYDDAADGRLRGNARYLGQTTGALMSQPFDLRDGPAVETVIFAAAHLPDRVTSLVQRYREADFGAILEDKRAFFADLLEQAPLPAIEDADVQALVRRALISLVSHYQPSAGAAVSSIATQSPYAVDWPRTGYYLNYGFDLLGLHDWVKQHQRFYARVQQRLTAPKLDTILAPPGNWGMAYYADGIAGGPIPYEIEETGYRLLDFWTHYELTGDRSLLVELYPTIRRAAEYLVLCQDPSTGLQCIAWEDDNFVPTESIVGATLVWKGLQSAVLAARELGHEADADRWAKRRDEVAQAIETQLWNPEEQAYGGGVTPLPDLRKDSELPLVVARGFGHAALAWPACFKDFNSPRMRGHLQSLVERLEPAFEAPDGGQAIGQYEPRDLIALAKAFREDDKMMAFVRRGLRWVATEWASEGTHHLGESWRVEDGEVVPIVSQPHWQQYLFYLAALEAWPPETVGDVGETCGGALEALRTRVVSDAQGSLGATEQRSRRQQRGVRLQR